MRQTDVAQIVHTIAAETNTPEEIVARLYADTLDTYRADASIKDYLPLFTERKVRAALSKDRDDRH
jgi:hypothetical protein